MSMNMLNIKSMTGCYKQGELEYCNERGQIKKYLIWI